MVVGVAARLGEGGRKRAPRPSLLDREEDSSTSDPYSAASSAPAGQGLGIALAKTRRPGRSHDVVARRAAARRDVGSWANVWIEPALVDVLATAVLDRGLPAAAAVGALLAVGDAPDICSPACPGPDPGGTPSPCRPLSSAAATTTPHLAALKQRRAEADGARFLLRR